MVGGPCPCVVRELLWVLKTLSEITGRRNYFHNKNTKTLFALFILIALLTYLNVPH